MSSKNKKSFNMFYEMFITTKIFKSVNRIIKLNKIVN